MDIKQLEKSQVELTLQLSSERIESEYSKKLSEYSKKIQLPGFRLGKAPASLIESKFGREIREEVTFKLMEDNLQEAFKEMDKKDTPLYGSTPVLQNEEGLLPFEKGKDVTYSVIYDVYPHITLPEKYTGLDIPVSLPDIDEEEELEKRISQLRERNAMIIPKNGAVAEGDIVSLNYHEIDQDGNKIEKNSQEEYVFTVGSSYNFFCLDKDIIGMKKDESKVIEKTYTEDMPEEYLNRNVRIFVEIKNIRCKELPDVDDDFAQDVNSSYKTLDDLKNTLKNEIREETEETCKSLKLAAYLKQVVHPLEISIPETLINSQLESSWDDIKNQYQRYGLSPIQAEKLLNQNGSGKDKYFDTNKDNAETELKDQLFIIEVQNAQNIKIDEEKINEELEKNQIKKEDPNFEFYKIQCEDTLKYREAVKYILENNNFTVVPTEDKKEEKKEQENEN